jgi:hypothetical protein
MLIFFWVSHIFDQILCAFLPHISIPLIHLQGPLFQQRPYPSPGAVLRKNAEIAAQQGKSSSHYIPIHKRGDGSDGLGDAD